MKEQHIVQCAKKDLFLYDDSSGTLSIIELFRILLSANILYISPTLGR